MLLREAYIRFSAHSPFRRHPPSPTPRTRIQLRLPPPPVILSHGPRRPVAGGSVLRVGPPAGARPRPPPQHHGTSARRARRPGLRAARHRRRRHTPPQVASHRDASRRRRRGQPLHRPRHWRRPRRLLLPVRLPPTRTHTRGSGSKRSLQWPLRLSETNSLHASRQPLIRRPDR